MRKKSKRKPGIAISSLLILVVLICGLIFTIAPTNCAQAMKDDTEADSMIGLTIENQEQSETVIVSEPKAIVVYDIISTPVPTPEPDTAYSDTINVIVSNEMREKIQTQVAEYEDEIIMLAKLLYREARGIGSDEQKAAVVWCVLNRADAGYCNGDVARVIKAPHQFAWASNTPVWDELYELAKDVLTRWLLEKEDFTNVGRILPNDYLYFAGNGKVNRFRQKYSIHSNYWDWSLENPYE